MKKKEKEIRPDLDVDDEEFLDDVFPEQDPDIEWGDELEDDD